MEDNVYNSRPFDGEISNKRVHECQRLKTHSLRVLRRASLTAPTLGKKSAKDARRGESPRRTLPSWGARWMSADSSAETKAAADETLTDCNLT